MELRYHGFLFHDYTEIGKIIKRFTPKIDVYLLDLIRFGLLEKYMKKQGDDYKKPELFARVQALRELYEKNHNRAYFHMAYDLDPDRRFYYDGRVYEDPKEFLKTRLSIRNLFEFAGSFEIDNAFLAWIEIMGQSALLERYESLISLVDEKARECAENGQVSGENQNSDLLALFYKGLNEK